MRLIDADAFAEFIKYAIKTQKYDALKVNDTTLTVEDVLASVVAELKGTGIDGFKNNPTIEPRKKGVWINDCCSICGYGVEPWNNTPYCPNCGAEMRR